MYLLTCFIALVIGLPLALNALGLYLQRKLRVLSQNLHRIEYRIIGFENLPWIARRTLATIRREIIAQGFQELVIFSRTNLWMLNFNCIYLSKAGDIWVSTEYVLPDPLTGIVMSLMKPKHAFSSLLGISGISIVSVFPPFLRLYTTQDKYLVRSEEPGHNKFNILRQHTSFGEMIQSHMQVAERMELELKCRRKVISSPEDYFAYDRESMARSATDVNKEAA